MCLDWDKEIDHEECSTVKECQEVGDILRRN